MDGYCPNRLVLDEQDVCESSDFGTTIVVQSNYLALIWPYNPKKIHLLPSVSKGNHLLTKTNLPHLDKKYFRFVFMPPLLPSKPWISQLQRTMHILLGYESKRQCQHKAKTYLLLPPGETFSTQPLWPMSRESYKSTRVSIRITWMS